MEFHAIHYSWLWGIHPALASASVHISEVFTTGVSGLAHWKFGNVDKEKVKKLLLPGIIGGIIGAFFVIKSSIKYY